MLLLIKLEAPSDLCIDVSLHPPLLDLRWSLRERVLVQKPDEPDSLTRV